MARHFVSANDKYTLNSVPSLTLPITISAWGNANTFSASRGLFAMQDDSETDGYSLGFTSNQAILYIRAGGTNLNVQAAGTFNAGTWYHVCAVLTSTTNRDLFINGGTKTNNTTSKTVSVADKTHIGYNTIASAGTPFYWDGSIAEIGLWNAALSDEEVLSLAKGASPLLIRPSSLTMYVPLIGKVTAEPDLMEARTFTATGSPTASAHPPVRYPSFHTRSKEMY